MTKPLTYQCDIHFRRRGRGSRRELETGPEPPRPAREPGRVPRVARLMALAIHFEDYLRAGQVSNYSELARLGHVTRPRISQIMNLLNLAPDIQAAILFLPRTQHGRDPIHLHQLQPIAAVPDWRKQRRMCAALDADCICPGLAQAEAEVDLKDRPSDTQRTLLEASHVELVRSAKD